MPYFSSAPRDPEEVKTVLPGRDPLSQELARPTWRAIRRRRTPQPVKPTVPTVKPAIEVAPRILQVAAYVRVSTDLTSQETSLDNQISHYSSFIRSEPTWELAGLYCEKDVSATNADRPELKRLIKDCRAGLIDLVLTKSISRFSRNTADCLRLVRELMSIGVNLWFEKENIHTDRMESELLLTILSAFAQDESRSISKNVRWGIQTRFRNGTYVNTKAPYGYKFSSYPADSVNTADLAVDDTVEPDSVTSAYVVNPAEAEIVRRIFSYVLDGIGTTTIAHRLNAEKVPTWTQSRTAATSSSTSVDDEEPPTRCEGSEREQGNRGKSGGRWYPNTVLSIIRNPFYVGDCLYQKTFMDENYIQRVNTGQFDQYLDEGNHEAIVTREVWEEANALLRRRWKDPTTPRRRTGSSIFSGKVFCSRCGKPLYRKINGQRPRLTHVAQQFGSSEPRCGTRITLDSMENVVTTMLNKIYTALQFGLPIVKGELVSAVLVHGLQEDFDIEFFCQWVERVDIGEGKVTVKFTDGTVLTEKVPPQFTFTSKLTGAMPDELKEA